MQPITCTPLVFGKVNADYFPLEDWGPGVLEQLFDDMAQDRIELVVPFSWFATVAPVFAVPGASELNRQYRAWFKAWQPDSTFPGD